MKNNGKVDASSEADMPTQISVGLMPLLLYPHDAHVRPPRVALVGFGSGVTAGAITQYPIETLEVVELEPAIFRASHFFDHINHRPLENPKVLAREGDGRNFLSQRDDQFDVIISQPSNPWITGVSNLFTREYFRDIKKRLGPGGLFCQWAQLYELAPWNIKTIFKTLREEFPYVYVFAAEDLSSDTIAIASMTPIKLNLAQIARNLSFPATKAEAARAAIFDASDVPAQLLMGPEEIEAFTAGAPVNTDDNALIEFAAPRDLLGHTRFDPYIARVYGVQWPYGRLTGVLEGVDGADTGTRLGRLGRSLLLHGKRREAHLWTARAEAAGGSPEAQHARLLLNIVATREDRDPEIPLAPADDLEPPIIPPGTTAAIADRIAREYTEIDALVRARRFATAYKVYEAWPDAVSSKLGRDTTLLLAFLEYKTEFYQDAIADLRPLADDAAYAAKRPAALYYLGRAHFANADYAKAIAALEKYISLQTAAERPLLPAIPDDHGPKPIGK